MTPSALDADLLDIRELSGSLADRVYEALHHAVMSMHFPPGTVLRKPELCAHWDVSRSPVSEAIARLSADGLVDVIPQSATRVSPVSMDKVREATFLREALELAAVARVAEICTDDQVRALDRSLRLQKMLCDDGELSEFYEMDEAFHRSILAYTGFPKLGVVTENVSLQLKRIRILLLPEKGRPAEVIKEHRAIVEAIRKRDPELARQEMTYHLGRLMGQIEPLEAQYPTFFTPSASQEARS